MSTKYPQGIITPTPPYKSTTAKSFSGVWTLEQLANNFYYYRQAISKSLRFRSSASAYLSRTPSVAGNRRTWTFSAWVKRGALGSAQYLLIGKTADNATSGTVVTTIAFTSSDTIEIYSYTYGTGVTMDLITTQVFRDPSSWYHIEVTIDTTQATSSNRAKLYVNGSQVTAFGTATYPSQNADLGVNYNFAQRIGLYVDSAGAGSSYLDGYMAEINFIDGQALDPSYFGQISPITGVWSPAPYVGSYGTNGFYLKFTDTTSTTTLCYDYSGNSNNWTPNNISLTAGSTYDSMLDSPTNYDNGGTGVGNYAVLNLIAARSSAVISSANLSVTTTGGNVYSPAPSSIAVSSGKWYFEALCGGSGTVSNTLGIALSSLPMSSGAPGSLINAAGTYAYVNSGQKYVSGSGSAYGAAWTLGDLIGVAFDADAGTLTFYKNGVSQGVATTGLSGSFVMFVEPYASTNFNVNFGQRPFNYTPPTGYKALNTQNLPAPSIQNGSNFMAATTYTGNGATQTIVNAVNGVSFQPDFIWIKSRSAGYDHRLQNSVVGMQGLLISNSTAAEYTASSGDYPTVTSSGFTLPYGTNGLYYNGSGTTFVAWQWKAGGTAVTNTAGSITSSVSANTTAGFSVVTYTGNGSSGATVGHGLGVAPAFIIIKDRTAARTGDQWPTYHVSIGATGGLVYLNSSGAGIAASVVWNNTNPSSSVFTLGNWGGINYSGDAFVAYCFAAIPGYSAFGSYTGNGSADGPFVYCGFRPRWVMFKCTSASGSSSNWIIQDTARNTYNAMPNILLPNLSNQEQIDPSSSGGYPIDCLSNGFKIRNTNGNWNTSGGTYIYAAFAENPFNYSLAR